MRKVRILVLAVVVAGFGLVGVAPGAGASCREVPIAFDIEGVDIPTKRCLEHYVCEPGGAKGIECVQ